MNVSRKAFGIGLAAIVLLAILWIVFNDEKAPDFPAIPAPEDMVAEERESDPVPARKELRPVPVEPATEARPQSPPDPAAPREPLSSELGRAARSDPTNPKRWVEFARAADMEGRYDIAVAALKRSLHVGGDFEGRDLVETLVEDYEEAVRMGRAPSIPMRILDGKGDNRRSRHRTSR